ncbi:AraC family transcriptional regulator [Flavobacterium sp. WLB]|uniref:helix-turn-helix domain-containing protein n=1 Tax=unclassified Flavobacterium TaxID=196869 RepID=UPI0006AB9C79|nr:MULTISPECIES: response regulator transcription factor [unclassified Flavobacterium]KOP39816.1 AraC family transcriptional regulator [Flavobacterium sp. VMW]OWU92604.1 AraC family transcriptional regulator [Flavobacterium sp. NLM]PUU68777.1 AraC family transcriptional regulator [Flavobacterium sp. WLB]
MLSQSVYTLVNQQNGNLSFKVFEFDNSSYFDHIQRNNYFTVIIITSGEGLAKVDLCEYAFQENTLFAFYPYQPFMLASEGTLTGISIQFHHDFFCIYRHHKEIAANGILFNNIYQQPFILLDQNNKQTLMNIVREIVNELKVDALRKDEVLVSYLKIFLVLATRIKLEQQSIENVNGNEKQTLIIQNLRNAIEDNFRTKHSASDYADMLHVTPTVLARTAKNHFNMTLSDLITERIIVEAKRELYLTNKTVKEIAYELGYDDEYYFSRVFKGKTDISPQIYRDTIGFNRGAS